MRGLDKKMSKTLAELQQEEPEKESKFRARNPTPSEWKPGECGNPDGRPLSAVIKCQRCAKEKPREDFAIDFRNPEEVIKTCRACTLALIAKPKYEKNAITNLIKDALEVDGYAAARAIVEKIVALAVHDGDMSAIKMLLDRLDGPVTQLIAVADEDTTRALVANSEALRTAIRKPAEETVH